MKAQISSFHLKYPWRPVPSRDRLYMANITTCHTGDTRIITGVTSTSHLSDGRMNRVFVTCCQVSLIRSKLSLPSSEQSQQVNLKKLSPLR